MNQVVCPITKEECYGEDCEWWTCNNQCIVYAILEQLKTVDFTITNK